MANHSRKLWDPEANLSIAKDPAELMSDTLVVSGFWKARDDLDLKRY